MTKAELEDKIKKLKHEISILSSGWPICDWDYCYYPAWRQRFQQETDYWKIYKKYGIPTSVSKWEQPKFAKELSGIIGNLKADLNSLEFQLQTIKQQEILKKIEEEYRKRDEQVRAEAAKKVEQAREEAERKIAQIRAEAEAKVQAAREEADRKVKAIREEKEKQFTSLTTQINKALGITDISQKIAVETYIPEITKRIQQITKEADEKVNAIRTQADEQVKKISEEYNTKIKDITQKYNQELERLRQLIESQSQKITDYQKQISKVPVLEDKLKSLSITLEERIKPISSIEEIIAKYLSKKEVKPEEIKPETKVQFNWKLLGTLGLVGLMAGMVGRGKEIAEAIKEKER